MHSARKSKSLYRRVAPILLAIIVSGAFAVLAACESETGTETSTSEPGDAEVRVATTDDAAGSRDTQKEELAKATSTPTFTVTSTFTSCADRNSSANQHRYSRADGNFYP